MSHHRLTEQLTYLLLRHEYVVIPQLGGFLREVIPARYEASLGLAYPPQAELHFSAELIHRDGLLEECYALALGVSLRRARLVLEEDVRALRQELLQQGSCLLPGIGRLTLSSAGRVSFEPQPDALAIRAVGYGYAPVSLPRLVTRPAVEPVRVQPEVTTESSYLSFRIPKRALAYAASLLIFVLALLPWGNRVTQEASYQAGFVPTLEVAKQLFGTATTSTPQTTPQAKEATDQVGGLAWQEEADGRFHIILATERQESQIEANYRRLQEELPQHSFVALRTGKGRMIRLSVGAYETSAEAYNALNSLVKEHPACRGAWVYASK